MHSSRLRYENELSGITPDNSFKTFLRLSQQTSFSKRFTRLSSFSKRTSRLRLYENTKRLLQTLFSKRYATVFFSVTLLAIRILHTGNWNYINMGWNLLLAFIPLMISTCMQRYRIMFRRTLSWVTLSVVWLLFLPNAPYMLTDLYHLPEHNDAPQWFDLIMLTSFVWNGLVWAYRSMRQMEGVWTERFPHYPRVYFTNTIIFLCGLGVFVGRYWRWNSWYVVTEPLMVWKGMTGLVFHPFEFREAWAFSICLAGLLWVMHPFMKRIA